MLQTMPILSEEKDNGELPSEVTRQGARKVVISETEDTQVPRSPKYNRATCPCNQSAEARDEPARNSSCTLHAGPQAQRKPLKMHPDSAGQTRRHRRKQLAPPRRRLYPQERERRPFADESVDDECAENRG